MSKTNEIKEILNNHPQHRKELFTRGYLISTNENLEKNTYPFYDNWTTLKFGELKDGKAVNIYCHNRETCFTLKLGNISIALIGHAYNPFNMLYNEKDILEECLESYLINKKDFFNKISELTGIHVIIINDNGKLLVVQDCAGMKASYYGSISNDVYITSHPQLLGDILNLKRDPMIESLMNKWFYSLGGSYLPGNLSPYSDVKRLGPNTFILYEDKFTLKRFYPTKSHPELDSSEYEEVIQRISTLINKNIELSSIKWQKPAISLTGGMDSKTTLASANGWYDKFQYYSFYSKPQELEDAQAARTICSKLGLKHTIYRIPDENESIIDFEILKKIIFHNSSYIDTPGDHEIRKFIYLSELNDFDVELKSWISEIGRAMWGKKYGVELPTTLTPRHFSIFQTRFLGSPSLLKYSDEAYRNYLQETNLIEPLFNYEHADMFYWEFRFGSWGANVVTSQDIFNHRVTMPMNNRKIMEMFLWFPHDYRKNDMVNKEIINYSNREITDLDINIKNTYLSNKRVMLEKAYYYYRTFFYKR